MLIKFQNIQTTVRPYHATLRTIMPTIKLLLLFIMANNFNPDYQKKIIISKKEIILTFAQ